MWGLRKEKGGPGVMRIVATKGGDGAISASKLAR
jgi:hypothetical protein